MARILADAPLVNPIDQAVALYRVEINGKLWSAFTELEEAEEAVHRLSQQGMHAVIVIKERKRA